MSRLQLLPLALVAPIAALAFAVPAMAHTSATVVNVTAGKPSAFRFTLSKTSVAHGSVTFKVTNAGTFPHTFMVCSSAKGGNANSCAGKGTATISPGGTATLTVSLTKGSHEYLCAVPGHAAGGMKGVLKVT